MVTNFILIALVGALEYHIAHRQISRPKVILFWTPNIIGTPWVIITRSCAHIGTGVSPAFGFFPRKHIGTHWLGGSVAVSIGLIRVLVSPCLVLVMIGGLTAVARDIVLTHCEILLFLCFLDF